MPLQRLAMEPPAAPPSPEHSAANSASHGPEAIEGAEAIDPATAAHPHDFTVQKEVHRQIRNDPDYDDWEYGTEPLPHESWTTASSSSSSAADQT